MTKPSRTGTRLLALAVVAASSLGAVALADTSSVPVTLGVVNGTRSLAVTGDTLDGATGLPTGPAVLNFGPATTTAPFGVLVSDVAYDRLGYDVTATLSQLYRIGGDGSLECTGGSIPATAFGVDFADGVDPVLSGVDATVESFLDFADANISGNVTGVVGTILGLPGTLPLAVDDVPGLVPDLSDLPGADLSSLTFMTVGDGPDAGTKFAAPLEHPDCPTEGDPSDDVGDSLTLQTGTPNTPDLSPVRDLVFAAVADSTTVDGVIDAAEAVATGLLPAGAAAPGGVLWESTRSAVESTLTSTLGALSLLGIDDADLDAITTSVVADLEADAAADLVFSLVGQTGIYGNVPTLTYDDTGVGATTGLYSGILTVTLTDRP